MIDHRSVPTRFLTMTLLSQALLILAAVGAAPTDPAPNHLAAVGAPPPAICAFAEEAAKEFGEPGAQAAAFLVAGMPARDLRSLGKDFLLENLRLAFLARRSFPWSKQVPDDLFLDCVLPYAQLDEPRDPWRREFYDTCSDLVQGCTTATEAAHQLNRTLFNRLGVKYSTNRKRPNQSPQESREQGMASCTGLSIILADACRSVGIPARVAGTAMWTNKRGNHTWVEVWDGGWHFTGAAEAPLEGLDRGWFAGDAARAVADVPAYAIWANTWRPSKDHFPLVWNPSDHSVPAVNVTDRYTGGVENKPPESDGKTVVARAYLRVLDDSGQRVAARVELLDQDGKFLHAVTTKAGASDVNDMPAVVLQHGSAYVLRVVRDEEARDFSFPAAESGDSTRELTWSKGRPVEAGPGMRCLRQWLCQSTEDRLAAIPPAALTQAEAAAAVDLVWGHWRAQQSPDRAAELKDNVIVVGDKKTPIFAEPLLF